ncbi:hypothetical protein BaRGS_00024091 [Batillaria attramentaria]|uniref:Uncharacterized protein n=1 Tax=Batillaria attramentaria TaxID=370345 RepID=A0ABD0KC61_9CAEN
MEPRRRTEHLTCTSSSIIFSLNPSPSQDDRVKTGSSGCSVFQQTSMLVILPYKSTYKSTLSNSKPKHRGHSTNEIIATTETQTLVAGECGTGNGLAKST